MTPARESRVESSLVCAQSTIKAVMAHNVDDTSNFPLRRPKFGPAYQ